MPRVVRPGRFSWIQISFPVAASSATSELFLASTYITLSTTIGLNR